MSFKKFSEKVAPRVHAAVLANLARYVDEVDVKKLEAEVMAELQDNWFRVRTQKVAVQGAYAEQVAGTMSRGVRRRRLDDDFKSYYSAALVQVEAQVGRVLRSWPSDVPDVVSKVMLNLWIHRDSIPQDPDKRRAFVITTAKNTCIDHIRAMQRRAHLLEAYGAAATVWDAGCVEAPAATARLSCRVPEECEVHAVAAALVNVGGKSEGLVAAPPALVEFVERRVRDVVAWIDTRAARDPRFPRERLLQTLVMGLQAIQQLAIARQLRCSASMVCHYIEFLIELFEDDDPPPNKPLRSRPNTHTRTTPRNPGTRGKRLRRPPTPTSSLEVFMVAIALIHECIDACEHEDVLRDLGLTVHDFIPGEFVRLEDSPATREAALPVRRTRVDNELLELEECEIFEESWEQWFEACVRDPVRGFDDAGTDPTWCSAFVSSEDIGDQCDSSDHSSEWRWPALMSARRRARSLVAHACGDDGQRPTDETAPICVPGAVWVPDGTPVDTPEPGSLDHDCDAWGYEHHPSGVYVRDEDVDWPTSESMPQAFRVVVLDGVPEAPARRAFDCLLAMLEQLQAMFEARRDAALRLACAQIDCPPHPMHGRTGKPVAGAACTRVAVIRVEDPIPLPLIGRDNRRWDSLLDSVGMADVAITTMRDKRLELAVGTEIPMSSGGFVRAPTGDRPLENVSLRASLFGVAERDRPRYPSLVTNLDLLLRRIGDTPEEHWSVHNRRLLTRSDARQDFFPHGLADFDHSQLCSRMAIVHPEIRVNYDHSLPEIVDDEARPSSPWRVVRWSPFRGDPQGWPRLDSRRWTHWRKRTVAVRPYVPPAESPVLSENRLSGDPSGLQNTARSITRTPSCPKSSPRAKVPIMAATALRHHATPGPWLRTISPSIVHRQHTPVQLP